MIVLGIGVVAWTLLLWRYGGAGPSVELDAIRTAGTLVVGTGGAVALLLAARRQRSTELTLEHERENAAEQRITELYTRAVDQLGAKDAPVRLGGLYALERLAQNNPTQRPTIINVICSYLRMPYTPPAKQAPGEDDAKGAHRLYEQSRQELQVRLTAQRILSTHLKPEEAAVFWLNIDLDLTDAYLYQLDLSGCYVRTAQFDGATFAGDAEFIGAKFAGGAWFRGAKFAEEPDFDGACVSLNSLYLFLPTGWTTRDARPAEGEEEGWLYVVRDDGSSEQPTGADDGGSDPGLSTRS